MSSRKVFTSGPRQAHRYAGLNRAGDAHHTLGGRMGHVIDVHRLKLRVFARRQSAAPGLDRVMRRKAIEELVLGSEYDRRAQDHRAFGMCFKHSRLRLDALDLRIKAVGCPHRPRWPRHGPCDPRPLPPRSGQSARHRRAWTAHRKCFGAGLRSNDSHAIHHRIGTLHHRTDAVIIADVTEHRLDLAHNVP